MTRYALLCGSAPQGKMQRKVDSMYDTLIAGGWDERDIMVFPNGIDEAALLYALTNLRMSGLGHLLIYVCTQSPTADSERTVWLGGNEIRRRILEQPASLAGFVRADGADDSDEGFEVQVVYDSGRDLISDEDWSYDDSLVEARFGGETPGLAQ